MAFLQAMPRSLIVEGNIGAGKSTFLKIIAQALAAQVVYEPHEKWQAVGGSENLLEKFYSDTQRWAYTFQTYAFVTRVIAQEEYAKRCLFDAQILERSVYSDRYCFAKTAYELGTMSNLEWKLYQEWFSWLVETYAPKPHGFIYLRTNPEICYKRLRKRNRTEEVGVSLDYLQKIHDKHEQWLMRKEGVADYLKGLPVLVLDCDQDFELQQEQQQQHLEKISDFFGIPYLVGGSVKVSSFLSL